MAKPVVRFYMSGLEGSRVIMSCDYPKASYQFRIYYFSSFSKKKTSPFHCLGLFIYILKSFLLVEHEKESKNEFRMQS